MTSLIFLLTQVKIFFSLLTRHKIFEVSFIAKIIRWGIVLLMLTLENTTNKNLNIEEEKERKREIAKKAKKMGKSESKRK